MTRWLCAGANPWLRHELLGSAPNGAHHGHLGRAGAWGDLSPEGLGDLYGEPSHPTGAPRIQHVLSPGAALVAAALQGCKPEQATVPRPRKRSLAALTSGSGVGHGRTRQGCQSRTTERSPNTRVAD